LSTVTNNGLLVKSAGAGTSVVDATYLGSGQVAVKSGTLALPDNQLVGGAVSPGSTLATGRCDGTAACQASTDPAVDTMSLSLTVPGTNGVPAGVQLQELAPVGAADPLAIGNEVLAHADQLVPDAAHPATITLRLSQPEVMATPLAEVQVVHTTDAGQEYVLPDCAGAALPLGINACIVRPVTRDAKNTNITVLTTQTSRWHARRDLPHENTGAPTVPQSVSVAEAAPFDGSAFKVTWAAPASEGAGPVSGYRVHVDGKLVASPGGTSAVVTNPGPGNHAIEVSAVNAAGTSGRVLVGVSVKAIARPRKVTGKTGKAGGKLTAGVTWKPPAEAGGLAIKGYVVAVYRAGHKIGSYKAKAGAHSLQVKLPKGSYTFKVRARNLAKAGPWSKPTDPVRAR
jgi:hypothetical protein